MDGFILQYKAKSKKDTTLLNHKLFGRIATRKYRGTVKGYYVRGMLDRTGFYRIGKGRIFVTSLDDINLEKLKEFGNVTVEEYISTGNLLTGREYWEKLGKDRGVLFVIRKGQNKKL